MLKLPLKDDGSDSLFVSLSVVEFRTEELMKKAVEKVNKHNLNGRPLKVKEVRKNKIKSLVTFSHSIDVTSHAALCFVQ